MLINCPKCGFSQPKDRYCASCGVDMDSFRPTPTPWSSRFWTNPTAPLGLTLAAVIVSFWYIRHQFQMSSRPNTEASRTFVRTTKTTPQNARNVAAGEVAETAQPVADMPAPPTVTEPVAPPPPPQANHNLPVGGAMARGVSDSAVDSYDSESVPTGRYPLKFTFIEVPKAVLNALLEEQRKSGANGLTRDQIQRLFEVISRKPEAELLSMNFPFQSNHLTMRRNVGSGGDMSDESELGLTLETQVNLRAPASNGPAVMSGTLNLNAHLKLEERGAVHSKEKALSTSFSFKPGNYWIYQLDLPRGTVDESTVTPTGIHRVFLSPSFQNHQTEVTLVVELDRQTDPRY